MPALTFKKEVTLSEELKSKIEYAGVNPIAPLGGGVRVFTASEKVEEV